MCSPLHNHRNSDLTTKICRTIICKTENSSFLHYNSLTPCLLSRLLSLASHLLTGHPWLLMKKVVFIIHHVFILMGGAAQSLYYWKIHQEYIFACCYCMERKNLLNPRQRHVLESYNAFGCCWNSIFIIIIHYETDSIDPSYSTALGEKEDKEMWEECHCNTPNCHVDINYWLSVGFFFTLKTLREG